ncbi:lipolytic protein [Burkholderia pyrrocinia]|nr:lipolytic protein [Burkholderia pyrrocinia]
MTLSPSGPLTDPLMVPTSKRSMPAARPGSDTYTYLRCWYRISDNPLEPKATYAWALDPGSGDWYRVPGYWWADGITKWSNMFYSQIRQERLLEVCRKTLDAQGIRRDVTQAVAANNRLSFNYTIWTLDTPQQTQRPNKLIVFGDSLSDTLNMYNASQWKLPNSARWHAGRFSNGPVWVEYLAKTLQLPFYNWATGGAATDKYHVVPGLRQQVESWHAYMRRAPNYRIENTLFMMFAGGNDLINYGRSPEQAANAVRDSLDRLARSGATHVMLINLPDVSRAPMFRSRRDAAKVAKQVKDYNHRLAEVVSELRSFYGATLNLRLFDSYALFDDLLTQPARYGFENAHQSCLEIGNGSALTYVSAPNPRRKCHDPARFVFWDTLHPTTRTHEWLAHYLEEDVRRNMRD